MCCLSRARDWCVCLAIAAVLLGRGAEAGGAGGIFLGDFEDSVGMGFFGC